MKKRLWSIVVSMMLVSQLLVFPQAASAAAVKYAEPASAAELAAAYDQITASGITFEIINGELWVWGVNRSGMLGITATMNPQSKMEQAVAVGDTIPWATKIGRENFGGNDIEKVFADVFNTFAIDSAGALYGWGSNYANLINPAGGMVLTPAKVPYFEGKHVLKIRENEGNTAWAQVKEADGSINWYVWGNNNTGQYGDGTTTNSSLPKVISIAGEEIVDMQMAEGTSLFLTKSGKVFASGYNSNGLGANNFGHPFNETVDATAPGFSVEPMLTPMQAQFNEANDVKIVEIMAAYRTAAARDDKGRVWTWGANGSGGIGNGEIIKEYGMGSSPGAIPKPYLAFGVGSENTNTTTKKAVKLFYPCDSVIVLCDDNTLYSWGRNFGARVYNGADWQDEKYAGSGGEKAYPYPMQVMAEASKKDTIVNLADDGVSFNVKTRSGDRYFVGDNSQGSSGGGTTEQPTPGETVKPASPTLPPVKPSTRNAVSIDIQYTADDGTLQTVSGTTAGSVATEIKAGQKFTVQVYFDDFAKLDLFTLPIRFTKERVQIVRKSGTGDQEYQAYPTGQGDNGLIIGKFGANTGLHSHVTDAKWAGGSLAESQNYPKINNEKGYFSVLGNTTTNNASIKGRQLMYSVDFIGTSAGSVAFEVMDAGMSSGTDGSFDPSQEGIGAQWGIIRQTAAGLDLESYYDFDACAYPNITIKTVPLESMTLDFMLSKDGKEYAMTDQREVASSSNPETKRKYFVIDKRNLTNVYLLKTVPKPTDASFADVTWKAEWDTFDGVTNPEGKTVSDYISVVNEGTKSYSFKIPEMNAIDGDGYLKFTAERSGVTIEPVYVLVTTLQPPKSVKIANKTAFPGTFYFSDGEDSLFTFEAVVEADGSPNTAVTWTAYNCVPDDSGSIVQTVIASSDKTAPAVILNEGNADGKPTAQVAAQHSTPEGSYVRLCVASTIDGSVADYVDIRVELLATGLTTDEVIYMSQNSSRQLSVSAEPYDAYKPEYEMTYLGVEGSAAPYITFDPNTGIITAGDKAQEALDEAVYDKIQIKEKKSDAYYTKDGAENTKTVKTVKVYVLKVIAPPDMSVKAVNNVGVENDAVFFEAELKAGDTLKIYKEFKKESTLAETYTNLSAETIQRLKTEGYAFAGGLKSEGGTMGYLVERAGASPQYTEVPVNYSSEPCKLVGYVRLEGRWPSSPQANDVFVEIKGLRDMDGNPVPGRYANDNGTTGYFEFEQYIPVGTYTIEFSKDKYITRDITVTLTNNRSSEEFEISTVENPVYLAPGDLTNRNRKVDPAEFSAYLYQWVGKVRARNDLQFEDFNFAEPSSSDDKINLYDMGLLLRYYNRADVYKDWTVVQ